MFHSMTAFGRATADTTDKQITVEIRSVNNRYLDCSARLPRTMSYMEEKIKPYLLSRGIARGKVEVSISVQYTERTEQTVQPDFAYADAYIAALRALRDRYALPDDISVMRVAGNPAVFTEKKPLSAEEQKQKEAREWDEVCAVLAEATDRFLQTRDAEGQRILTDLADKLQTIRTLVAEIETLSHCRAAAYRDTLLERMRALLADLHVQPDESRLLTECAIAADKLAIDEELVRLRSHFAAYEAFTQETQPVGRSIDFLLQEMNREINTIGSKAADAQIAQRVVDVKTELEKIREQIQNIE